MGGALGSQSLHRARLTLVLQVSASGSESKAHAQSLLDALQGMDAIDARLAAEEVGEAC